MAQVLTTQELATEFDTTPRQLRKFLRDTLGEGKGVVGKGARYQIERKQVRSLAKKFAAWTEAKNAANADNTPDEVEADIEDEATE